MGTLYPDFEMSDPLATPGFFTSAIGGGATGGEHGGDHGANVFDKSFGETNGGFMATSRPDHDPSQNLFASQALAMTPESSPTTGAASLPWEDRRTRKMHNTTSNNDNIVNDPSQMSWNELMGLDPLMVPSPPNSSEGEQQPFKVAPHTVTRAGESAASRYGQITPVTDLSPTNSLMDIEQRGPTPRSGGTSPSVEAEQSQPQPQPHSQQTTGRSTRKRARKSSVDEPTTTSHSKRTRRSVNTHSPVDLEEDDDDNDDGGNSSDKRSRFLERNRVAASKCRQKKKAWTNNLERSARELQSQKNHLNMLVGSLKDEVLFLKSEMLKHTDCGCERIRTYLDQEADTLAHKPEANDHSRGKVKAEDEQQFEAILAEQLAQA